MNHRTVSIALALAATIAATTPARAADTVLVMPTGARLACTDIGSLRMADMPRYYGVENFSKEYEQWLRLRTYAPRLCARAESSFARNSTTPVDQRIVASVETVPAR